MTHVGYETGGGFDHARCSDGCEDGTRIKSGEDAVEFVGHLPEPADVRPDSASARTARDFRGRFVAGFIRKRRTAARIAPGLKELSVHVQNAFRSGLFVEIVDVLSAEKEAIA